MHSCIYEGTVSHCRFEPVEHRFNYRLFMLFLDLSELPSLVGGAESVRADASTFEKPLISGRTFSTSSFLSTDHLKGVDALDSQVRDIVFNETGERPSGPIRLLTQLRYFGYYFSPLNLFYVYSPDDDCVESVVAEVNNTPWGERHLYLLWQGNRLVVPASDNRLSFEHPKQMHVSPFMNMDMNYRWRLSDPRERLFVCLENYRNCSRLFAASMNFSRRELNATNLRWMTIRYPFMTFQIIAAIHFQALKLWLKKCPVYLHPNKRHSTAVQTTATDSTAPSPNVVPSLVPQAAMAPTSTARS
ncbi:MAG: DUF1365 domain-containing protein [Pirellulales bacterium]